MGRKDAIINLISSRVDEGDYGYVGGNHCFEKLSLLWSQKGRALLD
jgi:hypothetical protein